MPGRLGLRPLASSDHGRSGWEWAAGRRGSGFRGRAFRWLEARRRSIRLADLLIGPAVQRALPASGGKARCRRGVQPPRGDPRPWVCNLGLQTTEKVAPGIAYRDLRRISDWRLIEENQRAALADIVHGISRLDGSQRWGEGRTSASDGQRFAMASRGTAAHLQGALQRLRPRVLLRRRRQLRPVLQPSCRMHRPRCADRARRRALPRE